jgi:hypothetical protein
MMATSVGTPQWKKAQADIRKTQSLPEAGNYLTWLLDDADPDTRAFVTHEIPKPVVFALTHLFGRSYNRTAAVWR